MSPDSEDLTLDDSPSFLFLSKRSRTQHSTNPRVVLSDIFWSPHPPKEMWTSCYISSKAYTFFFCWAMAQWLVWFRDMRYYGKWSRERLKAEWTRLVVVLGHSSLPPLTSQSPECQLLLTQIWRSRPGAKELTLRMPIWEPTDLRLWSKNPDAW